VSDRFAFDWCAAWNEAYTYPKVASWKANVDGKQAVALLGEMVSLQVEDFANAQVVCVNDVWVNRPQPVWRVSISFWNETDEDEDGTADPTNVVFEIELAAGLNDTADELDWFTAATPSNDTYTADYNKFRATCPVDPQLISRRRAEGAMVANSTAARVHTVGNANNSISFTFVTLGDPSNNITYITDKYVNEVRACARRFLAASSLRARSVHGLGLVVVADLGRAK
jgi:hypothetical protein